MTRKLAPALLTCLAASLSAPVFADSIPPITLPPTLIQQAGVIPPSGPLYKSDAFGEYSATAPLSAMTGPVVVSSSAYGGSDPSVSSTTRISGNPVAYAQQDMYSTSLLEYDFEIDGPANSYSVIDISATGGVDSNSSSIQGDAYFAVGPTGHVTPVNSDLNIIENACASGDCSSGSFSINQAFIAANNLEYSVELLASTGGLVDYAFLANAFVDPIIQLDPSDSSDDTLIFSPGIGIPNSSNPPAVPEPSSLILLSTGALALALHRRKTVSVIHLSSYQ
jgi:hypothetical protein